DDPHPSVAAKLLAPEVSGDLTVQLAGFSLSGGITFRNTGPSQFEISLKDVSLVLGEGDADTAPVSQTNVTGTLVQGTGGFAGSLAGKATLRFGGAPVKVEAGLALRINTTTSDYTLPLPATDAPIPAGSIQVSLNAFTLELFGQKLKGDFTFEQITSPAIPPAQPAKVVRVGATNVDLFLGDETAGAGVHLTGGTALFVMRATGLAGTVSGHVDVLVPGGLVKFAGTFGLQINTTGKPVSEQLTVGGATVGLTLPVGPYLRVSGDNIEMTFAGQRI